MVTAVTIADYATAGGAIDAITMYSIHAICILGINTIDRTSRMSIAHAIHRAICMGFAYAVDKAISMFLVKTICMAVCARCIMVGFLCWGTIATCALSFWEIMYKTTRVF